MDLFSDIPQHETKALSTSTPFVQPASTYWTLISTHSSSNSPPSRSSDISQNEQSIPRISAPVLRSSFLPYSLRMYNCIETKSDEHVILSKEQVEYQLAIANDGQQLYEWRRKHCTDKCIWFLRAKKALAHHYVKQHKREQFEQERAARFAEKKARLANRKLKNLNLTCKRCSTRYDANIKLHEHVRTKHSKKPKEPASEEKPPHSATIALEFPPATPSAIPLSSPSPPSATSIEPPALPASITSHATTPAISRKPIS